MAMFLLNILCRTATGNIVLRCDMIPEGVTAPRKGGSGKFTIDIPGNQETYIPGEQYTGKYLTYRVIQD